METMPAILIWGKDFRLEASATNLGQECKEIVPVDGGREMISWSSVAEMEALAALHGVSKDRWPIYRDCETAESVPLDDARQRSADLRDALGTIDPVVVQNDYWLSIISRLLQSGNSFFVMI